MSSLPRMKKNNMAVKYILSVFKVLLYQQTLNVYLGKQTVKLKDHVTDDFMSLVWSRKKLSGRTLLYRKFSLSSDKGLNLYSPRPSVPTLSLLFIILNAGRRLVIFKCPTQLKPQICDLF